MFLFNVTQHICSVEMKEMFYLMTHSTHFILRLYGVGHMVKDHSDSERGNPMLPHVLLFLINRKGSFICHIPHTTAFVTPVVEHWLERYMVLRHGYGSHRQ